MNSTIWRANKLLVVLAVALLLPQSAVCAGDSPAGKHVLYNGIELPEPWPPRAEDFPNDPQRPPYLASPPEVIPIDVGRQLFVDDFLVEKGHAQTHVPSARVS